MKLQRDFYDDLALMLGRRAKRLRSAKEWTVETLAKEATVNKNTIVRFEKGLKIRSKTIEKICEALGSSPFELMEYDLSEGEDYQSIKYSEENVVTRIKQRKERFELEENCGKSIIAGDLNYQLPGGSLIATVLEIKSRGKLRSHPGEEMVFVLKGKTGVVIGNTDIVLDKGESIFFWGTEPHLYYNADDDEDISVVLSVWIDPTYDIEGVHYHHA